MNRLLLILVWMIPLRAGAEPELGVAFKGGPNAATVAEDNRFNRYGLSGGLAGNLRWPLIDRFSLAGQIELLYTQRGTEASREGEYLGKVRQHYFDVTVAARPEARLGRARLYLLLGGGVNLLMRADKEDASGGKVDITGELHRIDVALLAGAGIALHLPHRALGPFRLGAVFLEARHDRGLIDTDAVNGGYKNRSSSLMLGLSFALASGAADSQPASRPSRSDSPPPAAAAVSAR